MGSHLCKPNESEIMSKYIFTPVAQTPMQLSIDQLITSNRLIEIQLKEAAEFQKRLVKLLLLGPGNSGKSTILKQMKILMMSGFSDEERHALRPSIYSNAIVSVNTLASGVKKFGLCFDSEKNEEDSVIIAEIVRARADSSLLTDDVVQSLKALWSDSSIQKCYAEHRAQLHLPDSAKYFLNSIDRIRAVDYMPNDQDMLECRVQTIGASKISFTLEGLPFVVTDVGGQKGLRKKWINFFDDVNSIIFVAAISEYDQVLEEDETLNRMVDSLDLFEDIVNNPIFVEKTVILFLNKRDLFEEKIQKTSIKVAFPDYCGDSGYEQTSTFIKGRFEERKREQTEDNKVYAHFTCGTDTSQTKFVVDSTLNTIKSKMYSSMGI